MPRQAAAPDSVAHWSFSRGRLCRSPDLLDIHLFAPETVCERCVYNGGDGLICTFVAGRSGMDIVADTSAIIAVIANEPEKSALVAHTQGADLFAPLSIPWEVGNAFSAMLKRQR